MYIVRCERPRSRTSGPQDSPTRQVLSCQITGPGSVGRWEINVGRKSRWYLFGGFGRRRGLDVNVGLDSRWNLLADLSGYSRAEVTNRQKLRVVGLLPRLSLVQTRLRWSSCRFVTLSLRRVSDRVSCVRWKLLGGSECPSALRFPLEVVGRT